MKTKKLLAFVLACLMVASVFPAMVFAAEETCPGHGEEHTLANCSYTFVEEIIGDCSSENPDERWTREKYSCNVCGDFFYKPTGIIAHDYEVVEEQVDATCAVPGKTAVLKCTKCGDITGGEEIVVEHEFSEHPVLNEDKTLAVWTCKNCDATKTAAIIDDTVTEPVETEPVETEPVETEPVPEPCQHSNPDYVLKTPTCTTHGDYHWFCDICGLVINFKTDKDLDMLKEMFPYRADIQALRDLDTKPLGHDWGEWTSTATCLQAGTASRTCNRCGEEETKPAAATDHTWETCTKKATCSEVGYTFEYCTNEYCDGTKVSEQTAKVGKTEQTFNLGSEYCIKEGSFTVLPIDPTNHPGNMLESYTAPTCTEDGWKAGKCAACGVLTVGEKIPATGHTTGIPETTPATCTEAGKKVFKCTVCGEVLSEEVIPATGHAWGANWKEKDCLHDTIYTKRTCETCGAVEEVSHEVIERQEITITVNGKELTYWAYTNKEDAERLHTVESWAIFNNVNSCENVILYFATCTVCGRGGDQLLYMDMNTGKGHTPKTIPAVEPTCTKTGLTAGEKCSVCGKILTAQEEIPALGHDMVMVKAVVPTCVTSGHTAGEKCSRCEDCNNFEVLDIDPDNHDLVDVAAVAAVCGKPGHTAGVKCVREGCEYTTVKRIPDPHNVITHDHVTATCANGGHIGYTLNDCANCDTAYILKSTLEEQPTHTLPEEGVSHKATCEENAYTEYTCTVCGEVVKVEQEGTAYGHENAAGKPIVNSCLDVEEDRFCVICEKTVDKKHVGDVNYITTVQPSCIPGYTVVFCTACQADAIVDIIDATEEHTFGDEYLNSKGEKVHTCEKCGTTEVVVAVVEADLVFSMSVLNAKSGTADFTDGSYINVTISVKSNKAEGTEVQAMQFSLEYDATVLEYVDSALTSSSRFGKFMSANGADGKATYVGASQNDANLTVTDAEDIVIMTFRIISKDATDFTISFGETFDVVRIGNADEEREMTVTAAGAAMNNVTITAFLNVNSVGSVDVSDLTRLITDLCEGDETYNVAADLNNDGFVDLRDAQLFSQYLSGAVSYEELVGRVVEETPETPAA